MKILTRFFLVVVLVTYWHSIVYANTVNSEGLCNIPLHQYLVGKFFKDKTDKLVEKYQSNGDKTVEVAYLPLMSVVTTQTVAAEQPATKTIAIFNDALYGYLASMAGESASINLTALKVHHTSLIAQILLICDDFLMTQAKKIQMIERLIQPKKVDVIVTGYYLEEEPATKVKLFVVSTTQKRIEGKGIVFLKDKLICSDSQSQDAPKSLCKEAYQKMVTTISALLLGEDSDNTQETTVVDDNVNTPKLVARLSDKKLGILPFSRLMSDKVKKKTEQYYDELESYFVDNLKKNGILLKFAEYPKDQEPFTYEEMTAPPFEIDPEDFATPELILSEICKTQGFDTVIFGHFEEVSDALFIVARVYSKSDDKITSVQPVQQIKLKKLEVDRVKTAIEVLAAKIVDMI